MRRSLITVAAVTLFLSCMAVGARGGDKPPKKVKKLIHLEAGLTEPQAQGIAKISAKTRGENQFQDFQVVGANLKASVSYDLFVDGQKIASKTADAEHGDDATIMGSTPVSHGAVEFLFSSRVTSADTGEGGPLPLPESLKPVTAIKKVEIKDADGNVVLSGEFD